MYAVLYIDTYIMYDIVYTRHYVPCTVYIMYDIVYTRHYVPCTVYIMYDIVWRMWVSALSF